MWIIAAAWSTTCASELTVGPGQAYTRLEEALAHAQPGDTLLVHPQPGNTPYERVALAVNVPGLTIKAAMGSGSRIPLTGTGYDYSGRGPVPRAIVQFNKGANGCLMEGFDLSGAHNASHNGAGVRINQANDVTIRSCGIYSNDMGVMSNGDGTPNSAANQLIENCLIYRNGDFREPGYNHNLYLGGTSVTLLGCEVYSSLTGHNVKSRAHITRVLACYVHDSANREFDLVDGKDDTTAANSDAVLAGNVIVKDRHCPGNRAVIHFGQDGGHEHDGTLHLIHNTIVTPFISPVVHLSSAKAQAHLLNNIVWDGGAHQNGQVLILLRQGTSREPVQGRANWVSSGFTGALTESPMLSQTTIGQPGEPVPFVDAARGDYHLAASDPRFVDRAAALPDDTSRSLNGNLFEYKTTAQHQPRRVAGNPDLGAFEWSGSGASSPAKAGPPGVPQP